jgi:hypothetical protein
MSAVRLNVAAPMTDQKFEPSFSFSTWTPPASPSPTPGRPGLSWTVRILDAAGGVDLATAAAETAF